MSKNQFAVLFSTIIIGFASVCATVYLVRPISDEERTAREERKKNKAIVKEFHAFMSGRKSWSEISDGLYGNLSNEELLGSSSVPVHEALTKMEELGAHLNLFAKLNGKFPENDDDLLNTFHDAPKFLVDSWGQPIKWRISLNQPDKSSFITCSRPGLERPGGFDLVLVGVACSQRQALIWQPTVGTFIADCDEGMALPLAASQAMRRVREEAKKSK